MKTIISIIAVVAVVLLIMFINTSKKSAGTMMNPETFKEKIDETPGVVIDVRTKGEYDSGHLKLTDYNYDVTNGEFQSKVDSLDKDKTYYLYCRSGNRSGNAVNIMKDKGFENVYNIGGLSSLARAGLATE
jgi:phage shock protein E